MSSGSSVAARGDGVGVGVRSGSGSGSVSLTNGGGGCLKKKSGTNMTKILHDREKGKIECFKNSAVKP